MKSTQKFSSDLDREDLFKIKADLRNNTDS